MKRDWLTVLGALTCFAVACSSGSGDRAPAVSAGGADAEGGAGGKPVAGGGGSGGLKAGIAGEGGTSGALGEAGALHAAGEAGALDGLAGDGGAGGLEQGMIATPEAPACAEAATWKAAAPVSIAATDAVERLLAITPDELDLVFVRAERPFVAHRAVASDPFGAESPLAVPSGYDVNSGVTLSADGTMLVLGASSGQGFASLRRTARTSAFGSMPDTTAFLELNQRALQTMEHYAAPVLAPDGKSLVFSGFTPEPPGGFPSGVVGVAVVYESLSSPSGWSTPTNISQYLFEGTTLKRPLPTGLSFDSRTLFYFDEGTGKQQARFRDRPDAPLYTVVDLGDRVGAIPNRACDALYYSSSGNVVVASM